MSLVLDASRDYSSRAAVANNEIAEWLVGFIRDEPDGTWPSLLAFAFSGFDTAERFRSPGWGHPVKDDCRLTSVNEYHVERIAVRFRCASSSFLNESSFQIRQGLIFRSNFCREMFRSDRLQLFQSGVVFRSSGEVRPFVAVGHTVVQLFVAIGVMNVWPVFGA